VAVLAVIEAKAGHGSLAPDLKKLDSALESLCGAGESVEPMADPVLVRPKGWGLKSKRANETLFPPMSFNFAATATATTAATATATAETGVEVGAGAGAADGAAGEVEKAATPSCSSFPRTTHSMPIAYFIGSHATNVSELLRASFLRGLKVTLATLLKESPTLCQAMACPCALQHEWSAGARIEVQVPEDALTEAKLAFKELVDHVLVRIRSGLLSFYVIDLALEPDSEPESESGVDVVGPAGGRAAGDEGVEEQEQAVAAHAMDLDAYMVIE
jgi:hypothetical protein